MEDDAVVIGRLQPLHQGHEESLIDRALDEFDTVYVGIGIPATKGRTREDPLTYEEREGLLDHVYDISERDEMQVFGIEDQGDDEEWIDKVGSYIPEDVTALTGNEWTGSCFASAGYDVTYIDEDEMLDRSRYSGTNVRQRAREGGAWHELVSDEAVDYLEEIGFEDKLPD
jgi:nicotinamide-nucleotide adenylyltransferase